MSEIKFLQGSTNLLENVTEEDKKIEFIKFIFPKTTPIGASAFSSSVVPIIFCSKVMV